MPPLSGCGSGCLGIGRLDPRHGKRAKGESTRACVDIFSRTVLPPSYSNFVGFFADSASLSLLLNCSVRAAATDGSRAVGIVRPRMESIVTRWLSCFAVPRCRAPGHDASMALVFVCYTSQCLRARMDEAWRWLSGRWCSASITLLAARGLEPRVSQFQHYHLLTRRLQPAHVNLALVVKKSSVYSSKEGRVFVHRLTTVLDVPERGCVPDQRNRSCRVLGSTCLAQGGEPWRPGRGSVRLHQAQVGD